MTEDAKWFAQDGAGSAGKFGQEDCAGGVRERLEAARARLARREDEYALEPEAAGDYEELPCGLRLNKPTIPHAWALAKASQAGTLDTYSVNLVTAYILSRTADEVRNTLMRRLTAEGMPEVVSEAEQMLIDSGALPSDVLEAIVRLTREAFPQKKGPKAD